MKERQEKWHLKLPTIIKETMSRNECPILGMAYQGQSFQLKRKCPVCITVYVSALASVVGRSSQDCENVGEADVNKIGQPRRCCAEALVSALCLARLGIVDVCQKQAGVKFCPRLHASSFVFRRARQATSFTPTLAFGEA